MTPTSSEQTEPQTEPGPRRLVTRAAWRRNGFYLVGLMISAVAIIWVLDFVGSAKLVEQLSKVRVPYVICAVLLTVTSYLLRAWRWRLFFEKRSLSFYDSARCLFVGFFMNNTLPARMGELVRAHFGGRVSGHSRTTVLATIAGERLFDGVTISAIFALLFFMFAGPKEQAEGEGVMLVALLFAAAALCTIAVIIFRHSFFGLLDKISSKTSHRAARFTLVRIRTFIEALEPMFRLRKFGGLVFWSVIVWMVELAAYSQVALAFGVPMELSTLGLFLAAVNFSSLVPSAPGGVGVIEAFATIALVHVGIDKEPALAMVTTQHLIQILVVGIPGILFFFLSFKGKVAGVEAEAS